MSKPATHQRAIQMAAATVILGSIAYACYRAERQTATSYNGRQGHVLTKVEGGWTHQDCPRCQGRAGHDRIHYSEGTP